MKFQWFVVVLVFVVLWIWNEGLVSDRTDPHNDYHNYGHKEIWTQNRAKIDVNDVKSGSP